MPFDNRGDRANADGDGLLGNHLRPLLEGRDETVDKMRSAIQDTVAAYTEFRTLDEEAAWAEGVGHLLDLFLTFAAEARWFTPAETHGIRAIGAKRAEQGFELAAMLESVHVAVDVARERIIAEYEPGGPDDAAALNDVLALLGRYARMIEQLLGEGHAEYHRRRRKKGRDELQWLVNDILDGKQGDGPGLVKRTAEAGWDIAVDRALFLTPHPDDALRLSVAAAGQLPGAQVIARSTPASHGVLVVPVPLPAAWRTITAAVRDAAENLDIVVLLVGACSTALDLRLRYLGSAPLLPHLRRIAEGVNFVDASDIVMYRIAAALPPDVRASLRHDVLGRIEAHGPDEAKVHLDNLGALVRADFRAPELRRKTGRHMRTIYDTRRTLSSLTGCSLTEPSGQAIVSLAYAAHRIDA